MSAMAKCRHTKGQWSLFIAAAISSFTITAEAAPCLSNAVDNVVIEVGNTTITAEHLAPDGSMKNVLVLGEMGMNIVSDRATWGEVGGAHLFLHSPSYLPRKLDGITVHNSGNMEIAIATNTPFILTVGRLKESRFRDVLTAGWFDGVVKGIPRLSKVTFCGHLVEDNHLWSGRVPVFSLSGIFLREFLDCSSLFGHIGAPTGVLEALGVTVRE